MQLGEEELLKLIQEGLKREVHSREKEKLFQIDYLQEGWSMMDTFFAQVTISCPSFSLLTSTLALIVPPWIIDNSHGSPGSVSNDFWSKI